MNDTRAACALRRRRNLGFTLAEVLAVISLLALLSMMLLGGLRLGVTFWDRGGAKLSGVAETTFAQGILRRSIEGAYPQLSGGGGGEGVIDFSGGPMQMSFVGVPPQSLSPAGLARIAVKTEPGREGLRLVLEVEPIVDPGARAQIVSETLLDNLAGVRFSYLSQGGSGGGGGWRSEWRGEAHMPALIRVEVDMRDGDPRYWPALIVAPRIDVDAACRYDALTKYCQGRRRP